MFRSPLSDGWTTVTVLAIVQALSQSGNAMVTTVTALTGMLLAERPGLATMPLMAQFLGAMAATVPAAVLMGGRGRRVGFSSGQAIGAGSALVAAWAVVHGQFWLFVIAGFGIGIHNAFWQQLRFAAPEVVAQNSRARAISVVLAGGIVAAIIGPQLAVQTRELLPPFMFAGCYVALSGLCLLSVLFLQGVRFGGPEERCTGGMKLAVSEILRHPMFLTATMSAAIGYGAMILVMSSAPPAIVGNGHGFVTAAFVIQWHVLAMYGPCFVTGRLIVRYGVLTIIGIGALLNLLAMLINVSEISIVNFWLGLVAVGIGWNFMFIGGTTLLMQICEPQNRARIQGLSEFIVFGTVALAGLSSGLIYATFGWPGVNAAVAGPIALVLIAIVRLKSRIKAFQAT